MLAILSFVPVRNFDLVCRNRGVVFDDLALAERTYFYRTIRQIFSSWSIFKGRTLYLRRAVNRQLNFFVRSPKGAGIRA